MHTVSLSMTGVRRIWAFRDCWSRPGLTSVRNSSEIIWECMGSIVSVARYRHSRWRSGTRYGGRRAQLQRAALEGAGKCPGQTSCLASRFARRKGCDKFAALEAAGCAGHGCLPQMCCFITSVFELLGFRKDRS